MAPHDYSTTYDQGRDTGGRVLSSGVMTSTRVPQPARVSRRPTPADGPVRQALVGALIGAVLDEMGPVGGARPGSATTSRMPRREKAPRVNARG